MSPSWTSLSGFSVARLQLEKEKRQRAIGTLQLQLAPLRNEHHQALMEDRGSDYLRGVRLDMNYWQDQIDVLGSEHL